MSLIQPRTLKGFRDIMPARAHLRRECVRKIEDVFRAYGYAPIETPALEYAEILKGKGGEDSDRELFEFQDKGGRDVALRFDLTVPLARFVAQHQGQLVFPFRRAHIGSCWRGERPQRGRAREFLQCDVDLIGAVGVAADAEILSVVLSAYDALDVGRVTLRVNDRRVLNALIEQVGAADQATPILRALDKRAKQGDDAVVREMGEAGLAEDSARRLLSLCTAGADNAATLASLREAVGNHEDGRQGVDDLEQVCALVAACGSTQGSLLLDPAIARGLDYYTGIVMEGQLDDLPGIGSIGGGGRYDDLAGLYTKTRLPGVGFSIGILRLIDALDELGRADTTPPSPEVMVVNKGSETLERAFVFATTLRTRGVSAEVYPEAKKHGAQMRYADRQGIRYVFTPEDEGGFHGKRMADGETHAVVDGEGAASWILG